MSFLEVVKKQTDEKYLKLLSGESEYSATSMEISSCDEYKEKYRNYKTRIKKERNALNDAMATIQSIKEEERLAAEKKERQEKERQRLEEEARLEKERQEKWEREAPLRKMKEEMRRKEEAKMQKKAKVKAIITSIAVIVAIICAFALLFKGIFGKYSDSNIDISVIEKYNEDYSYTQGLNFTLVFEVENKGSLDVHQLVGNLKIYNSNGDCLLADTLTLNGIIEPDKLLRYDVDFKLSDTVENRELYDTDLSGLKMTYQLTMVEFEDYKEKEYKNGDEKIICDVSDEYVEGINASDNSYQDAVNLFNQGKYAEAIPLFKALGDYKDSSDYYVQSMYNNALALYSQEKFGEAYKSLKEINGYEDTNEKMSEITTAALAKAESVAATGDYAAACKIIEQVDFDESSLLHQAYTYAGQGNFAEAVKYGLTVVVIPEGMEVIPDNYLNIEYGTNEIKKVVLPSTLKSIGNFAFDGCSKLVEINLPDGLKTIGVRAFYGCKSLKSIEIPDSVESMGANAFQNCNSLTTVTLSSGLKEIPLQAFVNCSSLTTVTFKSGVEVIGSGAFSGCSSLINVTLPESLKEIQSSAFYKCTSLVEITIPSQVNIIEYSAFSDCTSLQRVYFDNHSGWEYNYGTALDVSDARNNAKVLRSIDSTTWERK